MNNVNRLLERINPALNVLRVYQKDPLVAKVCLESGPGETYVLKEDFYQKEGRALVSLSGMSGIAQLVEIYNKENSVFLLKEHFLPCTLRDLGGVSYFSDNAKNQLLDLVKKVHRRGVANLDLRTRNVAIDVTEDRVGLFDFSSVVFLDDLSYNDFLDAAKTDYEDLRYYLGFRKVYFMGERK